MAVKMRWVALILGFAVLAGCSTRSFPGSAETVRIGRSVVSVQIAPEILLPHSDILEWVRRGGIAVTNCLGRFPVNRAVVTIHPGGDQPIGHGVAHGATRIDVDFGEGVAASDLNDDWVLTHEMFHLGFPTLDNRYSWMMEGLSDYLEPIARARAGQKSAQSVWAEFFDGLPQGLPQEGEGGLDGADSRERIYWGGTIYWLLADVRIRQQTQNRRSVDDAVKAILAAGGNGAANWDLDRVLKVGDKATGTTVLADLHEEIGLRTGKVDLNALWENLGVSRHAGTITFNENSPLADIRKAITAQAKR